MQYLQIFVCQYFSYQDPEIGFYICNLQPVPWNVLNLDTVLRAEVAIIYIELQKPILYQTCLRSYRSQLSMSVLNDTTRNVVPADVND